MIIILQNNVVSHLYLKIEMIFIVFQYLYDLFMLRMAG